MKMKKFFRDLIFNILTSFTITKKKGKFMNGSTSLLEMRHISFTYPTKQQKSLEDISFSIKEGSFVVLCGQSGSGKSTLLRHIKKNQIPFGEGEGECLYAGTLIQELSDYDNAIEIGYVGQNPESQLVTDRVWHELAFGLENIGMETENIRRKVTETAEYFGMSSWFRKDVMKLSGGQKQLLNLASVMAMEPRFLLLDEPTEGLYPNQKFSIRQTIKKYAKEHIIIISTHTLEDVEAVADRDSRGAGHCRAAINLDREARGRALGHHQVPPGREILRRRIHIGTGRAKAHRRCILLQEEATIAKGGDRALVRRVRHLNVGHHRELRRPAVAHARVARIANRDRLGGIAVRLRAQGVDINGITIIPRPRD